MIQEYFTEISPFPWHQENIWQICACGFLFFMFKHSFSPVNEKTWPFPSSMKTVSNELLKLRSMAEQSLKKTAELQQVLAQIEATLSRAETQKVIQKTGGRWINHVLYVK